MAEEKDFYKILGVSKNASDEELKRAYRKLSMQYHPDRQNGKSDAERKEAEEKFKAVNEAYSVLKDKDKRASYDQFGSEGPQGGGFNFGGFDPADFFRKMRGSFSFGDGGFGDFGGFGFDFGGSRNREAPDFSAPHDGDDVQIGVSVSFKDSMLGCTKEFEVTLDKECPECGGSGVKKGTTPKKCGHCDGTGRSVQTRHTPFGVQQTISACPHCGGTGYETEKCEKCSGQGSLPEKRIVSLKVPQGCRDGQRLRMTGKGRCGRNGGRHGDMYVVVSVGDSDIFVRRDNDVAVSLKIPMSTAVLGGNVQVPTPYGYRKLEIKPCTGSGTIRIPGAGVKTNSSGTGDLYVELSIEPASNLTREQRELFENLAKTETASNYPKSADDKVRSDKYYAS